MAPIPQSFLRKFLHYCSSLWKCNVVSKDKTISWWNFHQELIFTSGSSKSLSGVPSVPRRSFTASLYISIAENFNTNALSSCYKKKHHPYYKYPKTKSMTVWKWKGGTDGNYPLYIAIYVGYSIFSYSIHRISLSTTCLPICKNACWSK